MRVIVRRSLDPREWDPPFSLTEIEEMEQRVTNRAAQLVRLIELDAPQVILDNQRRIVDEARERLGYMAERPGPPTRISRRTLLRAGYLQWRADWREALNAWFSRQG